MKSLGKPRKSSVKLFARLESSKSTVAIRNGLAMIIPFLTVGSACLILRYFPVTAYRDFIGVLFGGYFIQFLDSVYAATFGLMSIYLTATISYCYARENANKGGDYCSVLVSLACFFLLAGSVESAGTSGAFGVKGMFTAILASLLASMLYFRLYDLIVTRKRRIFSSGANLRFNAALTMLFPATIVLVLFACVNLVLRAAFDVTGFYDLTVKIINAILLKHGRSFFAGFLYVFLSSLMWFFGIHGSNVLENVAENLFTPALQINADLVAAGQAPTEIFSKQFFDVFVLMGGCGTAICLLIAILLFGRRRSNRGLAGIAAFPVLFNINEILTFGFPVVFNVTLFIPFLLVPVFSFLTTYFSMRLGLVPLITSDVNWTIPVLVGGYVATGSIRGSILQLVNIVAGVFIYRPFIIRHEKKQKEELVSQYNALVATLKKSESSLEPVRLTELPDSRGAVARTILGDIRHFVKEETMPMYYQPQFDGDRRLIGAESLLRWKHPVFGMFYPPLVIELAREDGLLVRLEEKIVGQVTKDAAAFRQEHGFTRKISVNVAPATVLSDSFLSLLTELANSGEVKPGTICLEITEQTALIQDATILERLRTIRALGYRLAIDDFSMGHTSLSYLQDNQFDIVKLDGSLIRGLDENPRCADIVRSIMTLSSSLGFTVLAECVETEQQLQNLAALGCRQYQGYLYSPAVSREAFAENIDRDTRMDKA